MLVLSWHVRCLRLIYVDSTRSTELQILAIMTLTFFCAPIRRSSYSLASYMGTTIKRFRSTCYKILVSRTSPLQLKKALLGLLAAVFEHQPALAERFLPAYNPVNGVGSTAPFSLSGSTASTSASLSSAAAAAAALPSDDADEDVSILEPLKEYIKNVPSLFEKQPSLLVKVFHILFSAWEAAPAYQNMPATLKMVLTSSFYKSCDLNEAISWCDVIT